MLDTVQFSSSIEEREEEGTFVLHVLPSPVSLTSNQLKNFIGLLPLSQHIFFAPSSVSLNQVMRPPCSIRRLFHSASFLSLSLCKALPSCDALSFFLLPSLLLCFITSIFPFPLWLFPFSFTPPVLCSYVALKTWTGRRRTSEKTENLMHVWRIQKT